MAKVSILTPVKADDAEDVRWLGEAIASVQAQTEKDWEMIVINDHSDHSLNAIRPLFRDPRVKGAKAERIGVAHARNQAARLSSSPLLLPLDADDRYPKEAIAEYLRVWEQVKDQYGLVYGNTVFFSQNSQRHYKSGPYNFDQLLKALLMPVGTLHRKSDWQKSGGWKAQMEFGLEDWEYWVTLGELGVCGYHYDYPLYMYRRHEKGRLHWLHDDPDNYALAHARLRDLHKDTYNGRRPPMCCGNGNQAGQRILGSQFTGGSGGPGRVRTSSQALRATLANTDTRKLVPIVYIGKAQDFYAFGKSTGIRYGVERRGELLTMPDGRKGVHKDDVAFLISLDRGTSFTIQ